MYTNDIFVFCQFPYRYNRYKVIVQGCIGELRGQSVRVASRCLWDDDVDGVASYWWAGADAFSLVVVFGIYQE